MIKLAQLIPQATIDNLNKTADTSTPGGVWNGLRPVIMDTLTKYILPTAFFLVVLFAIYGGILYFTAYGNEEKATKGRNTFTYAIIGAIIVALAWVIVRFVSETLFNSSIKI